MLVSVLHIMVLTATSDALLPLLPVDPYRSVYLVRGAVIGGREAARYTVNEIRIDHVYHGPEGLMSRTFSAISADELPEGSNPYITIPALRAGETVIAVVTERNGRLTASDEYNFTCWPVRETGNPEWMPTYQTIKVFAETVEGVSQLSGRDEAAAALKLLAANANPYVSSWAIARLSSVCEDATDALPFLEQLASNEHVPIQGQVALDRALLGQTDMLGISFDRPKREWQTSPARLKLVLRWFDGAPSKRDAHLAVTRVDLITQHPDNEGLSQDDLMRVVTTLVKNDRFPLSERQRAGTTMSWAARRYESDDKVFEAAVELASCDLPEQVRMAIAGVFVGDVALDEKRRSVLVKLRDNEKSKPVAAILTDALARNNDAPKRHAIYRRRPKTTAQPVTPNAK